MAADPVSELGMQLMSKKSATPSAASSGISDGRGAVEPDPFGQIGEVGVRHPHHHLVALLGTEAPDVLEERRKGGLPGRAPDSGGERVEEPLGVQEGPVAERHPVLLAVAEKHVPGGSRVPAGHEAGRVPHGPRAVHVDERMDHLDRLGFRLRHEVRGSDPEVARVKVVDVGVSGHPAARGEVAEAFEFRFEVRLLPGPDRHLPLPGPELDAPLQPDGGRSRGQLHREFAGGVEIVGLGVGHDAAEDAPGGVAPAVRPQDGRPGGLAQTHPEAPPGGSGALEPGDRQRPGAAAVDADHLEFRTPVPVRGEDQLLPVGRPRRVLLVPDFVAGQPEGEASVRGQQEEVVAAPDVGGEGDQGPVRRHRGAGPEGGFLDVEFLVVALPLNAEDPPGSRIVRAVGDGHQEPARQPGPTPKSGPGSGWISLESPPQTRVSDPSGPTMRMSKLPDPAAEYTTAPPAAARG